MAYDDKRGQELQTLSKVWAARSREEVKHAYNFEMEGALTVNIYT
jgi:hypothetical protein